LSSSAARSVAIAPPASARSLTASLVPPPGPRLQAGGCSPDLWLDLAERREAEDPEDALAVWKGQMEPTIGGKNADAYRHAIELLRKIHRVLARLGRSDEFAAYIDDLRANHKRLRNLMKMLDRAAWT